jgi:hypothetical protein
MNNLCLQYSVRGRSPPGPKRGPERVQRFESLGGAGGVSELRPQRSL